MAEEWQITKEKVAVEVKRVAEEEQRRVEVAVVEAWWITKEKTAVARQRATLEVEAKHKAKEEWQVEEMEMEQGGGLPSNQKGKAEGEQLVCDCCVTWGFDCQVIHIFYVFNFC